MFRKFANNANLYELKRLKNHPICMFFYELVLIIEWLSYFKVTF